MTTHTALQQALTKYRFHSGDINRGIGDLEMLVTGKAHKTAKIDIKTNGSDSTVSEISNYQN